MLPVWKRLVGPVVLLLAFLSSASATNIVELIYTGPAVGAYTQCVTQQVTFFGDVPTVGLVPVCTIQSINTTATQHYTFDTDRGTWEEWYDGFIMTGAGVGQPFMTFDGLFDGRSLSALSSYDLIVQGDQVWAPVHGTGFPMSHLGVFGGGTFQFGTCPGSPCGSFGVSSLTIIGEFPLPAHTPGPVVGAGLPGLLLLGALGLWQARARYSMG
jgi:hypothetical protein